jgi:hypothetical protein
VLFIFSSETALTWLAMDCSEDPSGQLEKLAVKFKLAETKEEFKKAFETAQANLKAAPRTPSAIVPGEKVRPAKVINKCTFNKCLINSHVAIQTILLLLVFYLLT